MYSTYKAWPRGRILAPKAFPMAFPIRCGAIRVSTSLCTTSTTLCFGTVLSFDSLNLDLRNSWKGSEIIIIHTINFDTPEAQACIVGLPFDKSVFHSGPRTMLNIQIQGSRMGFEFVTEGIYSAYHILRLQIITSANYCMHKQRWKFKLFWQHSF